MVERYVDISLVDVELAVVGICGIKDMEVQKPIFVPGICPHCLCKEITPTASYYPDCGTEFTEEALTETEALMLRVNKSLSVIQTVQVF
jgi:hypothetical protein